MLIDYFVEEGYKFEFGVCEFKCLICSELEIVLVCEMFGGGIGKGDYVSVCWDDKVECVVFECKELL